MKAEMLNRIEPMPQKANEEAAGKETPDGHSAEIGNIRKSRKQPELPDGTRVTAGQLVAVKLRERGWSQEELAARSGVSRTQIGRIERDESIPSMISIEGLETALGIELYNLFLEQKREQSKIRGTSEETRCVRDAIGGFRKKLEQKGIVGKDLDEVLSGALKSAEDLLKRKKSE